jgi:hypothetical protein
MLILTIAAAVVAVALVATVRALARDGYRKAPTR